MEYGEFEILEKGNYTGKKEFPIYNNGEYICTAADPQIAELIIKALEKQIPRKIFNRPWAGDNTWD